jgi:hypothetical protein
MNPVDRARLTTALRGHVANIAAELRIKVQAPGPSRVRAERLHSDERVAEDFEVWTDLLSRRGAVLWVLKSVYVRVLEDRALLAPGRLLDLEAQQLFERLAPHLGETAFLRWVYRDLASPRGGLPELFSSQPAEVALPSDALSRELIEFWRHRDADTGSVWSFAEERFEGELMGDLYQDLDPVVKDRFALCQTPDFVRSFILDRTLTPAIETFGGDVVRLLDPACGSGHFLIDGLKRLVAETAAKHPDWHQITVVSHALDRVVGLDLNDYACALARTRLIMTAAELADVTRLADAAQFHPHVYWADGLEQVERDEVQPSVQFSLFEKVEERPRSTLTRSDVRAALKRVLATKFHAVVANPPYIQEADDVRKAYHREKIGRTPRFLSAYQQYHLSTPFTERCFQLAVPNGRIGVIIDNQFMKRDFGIPFVEKVLSSIDLTLVVDSSQAYIPHHGTATALLFAANRRPTSDVVPVVRSKRREPGTPEPPQEGKVWLGILQAATSDAFENEFVALTRMARTELDKHEWILAGGGAAELAAFLESAAASTLGSMFPVSGRVAHTGADGAYAADRAVLRRAGIPDAFIADFVEGDRVRDWALSQPSQIVFPYEKDLSQVSDDYRHPVIRWLWPFRSMLWERREPQGTHREIGFTWHQYSRFHPERFHGCGISFAFTATHNHFVFDRGSRVFKLHSPIMRLRPGTTNDDYFAILGPLNSSTSCFWMKQKFFPKSHATQRHHPDPARATYEFALKGMKRLPLPELGALRERFVAAARLTHSLMNERQAVLGTEKLAAAIASSPDAEALRVAMSRRWTTADSLRERAVALQEEIDWLVYAAFGLAAEECLIPPKLYEELTCPRGDRPFERISPRTSTVRARRAAVDLNHAECPPVSALPEWAEDVWQKRVCAIKKSERLQMMETSLFKRAWRDTEQNLPEPQFRVSRDTSMLSEWLATRIEEWAMTRSSPFTIPHLVAAVQDDRCVLRVAEVLAGKPDFSLDALVAELVQTDAVPLHPFHVYTQEGLAVRESWAKTWEQQRREDSGEKVETTPTPSRYSQGSRGKPRHFLKVEYWKLRGDLDLPKERFVAFTEVPGRGRAETLYGWAGWTPVQRLKALLLIDEELEDSGFALSDRIGLLDNAWRLLPDVLRDDRQAATRLRAELQALVGPEGPSRELIEAWKRRFQASTRRLTRCEAAAAPRDNEGLDIEERDEV